MGRPGLTRHRKFPRLARALGSPMLARGALELLWDACYEAGDDYVGTAEDIEALVGWTGKPGELTRALCDAGAPEGPGFIEAVDGSSDRDAPCYRVHDLWHHAPDYVRKRRERELERRKRVAPSAKRRRTTATVRRTAPNGGTCSPSPDSQTGVDRTPAPAPAPAPTPTPAPEERTARAREPRYAYRGSVLALTPGQHEVLVRMLNTVDLDLLGEVYPRWNRTLEESGEPFDPLDWCTAQLKREVGIRRPATPSETDFQDAERTFARLGRDCHHQPRCPDRETCVGKLAVKAMLRRTKPLSGRDPPAEGAA